MMDPVNRCSRVPIFQLGWGYVGLVSIRSPYAHGQNGVTQTSQPADQHLQTKRLAIRGFNGLGQAGASAPRPESPTWRLPG